MSGAMSDLAPEGTVASVFRLPSMDLSELSLGHFVLFECDRCGKSMGGSVVGGAGSFPRYHCWECFEDLCPSCYDKRGHKHPAPLMCKETSNQSILFERVKSASSRLRALGRAFHIYGGRPLIGLRLKDQETYDRWISYSYIGNWAGALGVSLTRAKPEGLGLQPGSHIGIAIPNSVEWILADVACCFSGYVSVPIHVAMSTEKMIEVAQHSDLDCIITTNGLASTFASAFPSVAIVECVSIGENGATYDNVQGTYPRLHELISRVSDVPMPDFFEFMEKLSQPKRRFSKVVDGLVESLPDAMRSRLSASTDRPSDFHYSFFEKELNWLQVSDGDRLTTIINTSGSTGRPKGSMFPDMAFLLEMRSPLFHSEHRGSTNLIYRPLALASERYVLMRVIASGGRCGLPPYSIDEVACASNQMDVFDEGRMLKVTSFSGPPLLFEMLQNAYSREVERAEQEAKAKVSSLTGPNVELQAEHLVMSARRAVAEKYESCLGRNLRHITVGGSYVSNGIYSFITKVFSGIAVTTSYGCTEVGGITRDGIIHGDVDVKLMDIPELGYTKETNTGEVLVRTNMMVKGYYKDPINNADRFVEGGYFRTGDIGRYNPETKQVILLDRLDSHFKAAHGEWVAPVQLEACYGESLLIRHIFLHGVEGVVCGAVLPSDVAHSRYGEDVEALEQALLEECGRIAVEKGLRSFEIPRAIIVEMNEDMLSEDKGTRTASNKPCRRNLVSAYQCRMQEKLRDKLGTGSANGHEDPVVNVLRRVLRVLVPAAAESTDMDIWACGADSIVAMGLHRAICAEFGPVLMLDEMMQMNPLTVSEIAAAVKGRGHVAEKLDARTKQPARPYRNWEDEVVLPLSLESSFSEMHPAVDAGPGDIFLTGATGFVGSAILAQLAMLKTDLYGAVVCLVRAANDVEAVSRISQAVGDMCKGVSILTHEEFMGVQGRVERGPSVAIVAVAGDVAEDRFGLSEEIYKIIASRTAVIIHCAAGVTASKSYDELKHTNVNGVLRCLEFSVELRPKHLVHISSLSAVAVADGSQCDEHSRVNLDDQRLSSGLSGYGQTKWICEELIIKAWKVSGGVFSPAILRLGMVGCDRRTGSFNEADWLTRLMEAVVLTGSDPQGNDTCIDLIPVGDVAAMVTTITTGFVAAIDCVSHSGNTPLILHLNNPSSNLEFSALWSAAQKVREEVLARENVPNFVADMDVARSSHPSEMCRRIDNLILKIGSAQSSQGTELAHIMRELLAAASFLRGKERIVEGRPVLNNMSMNYLKRLSSTHKALGMEPAWPEDWNPDLPDSYADLYARRVADRLLVAP